MKTVLLTLILLTASIYAAPPNVILILVDDFGYECVTANGGQSYQTKNLDTLAASGLRFENCHVQPLCTPTRGLCSNALRHHRSGNPRERL